VIILSKKTIDLLDEKKFKLGQIIEYATESGEILPAIVVKVNDDDTANLQVFEDGNGVRYIPNYEGGKE